MSEINSFSDYQSKYNTQPDYSSLFGVGSSYGSGYGSSGNGLALGDYMAIQNGSYKKLLKTYYANQKAEKASSGVDNEAKSKVVKESANNLKKAADALTSKDFWKKNEGNREEILKAVKTFVDCYNKTVSEMGESDNKSALRSTVWMTQMTSKTSALLEKVGITVGADNKLSIDEDKFNSAYTSDLKSIFSGYGSYASRVSQKASSIANASSQSTKTYTSSGSYSDVVNKLVSEKVDKEV